MDKLQIKQISGKPAVKYSDIEPGVVFTFNDGSLYGDSAYLKTYEGRLHLVDFRTPHSSVAEGTLCTVYKSTLTMEV
jgi:hypothetical protein